MKREIELKKSFPYQPDIGANKNMTVEKNKRDFFQRLYSHEDPNIGTTRNTSRGRMRASSADRTRRDSTRSTSASQLRSRSISRSFTAPRRREIEEALRVSERETSYQRTTPKKVDLDLRLPWGHPHGDRSLSASASKRRPALYDYVLNDINGTSSASITLSRSPVPVSRTEQLRVLANNHFNDLCRSKYTTAKITANREETLIHR